MKVSVIICTYQRCNSVKTALESVACSTLPDTVDWEVLVVDNNSRDQTRKIVLVVAQADNETDLDIHNKSPNVPRPSEDTEFGRRLMAAGERLRY